jgi:hypothetical protein
MFCMPIGTISRANNSTNWVSSTTILGQYSYYNQSEWNLCMLCMFTSLFQ